MPLQHRRRGRGTRIRVAAATAALLATSTACAGAGGTGSGGDTINVLMVNNPQMMELQKLTAAHFTKETGIKVNFTVLPENDVRDKISQDFSNQGGQYDVATISNYEVPFFAKNGWLHPLDDYVAKDAAFDQKDILRPLTQSLTAEDGKLYAEPFYGESSFLMYRKDVFAQKGLKMPEHPTWQQVADLAAKADGAQPGMKGICLRGLPGWGELAAPLTTVVNTMGGTWFDKDWKARLDSPEFEKATKFYVDLVRSHGETGAAQSGFAECLNNLTQGKTAMWYDATSAAGSLEAANSPVKGKIGYVPAPVERTKSSGWLYTWAWGMEKASRNTERAWKFISWASGKKYEELVGEKSGWANVPAGG
ncbi:sugar ABC transporter substrate-binding protein, partial [Streptomyces varsoviensis]